MIKTQFQEMDVQTNAKLSQIGSVIQLSIQRILQNVLDVEMVKMKEEEKYVMMEIQVITKDVQLIVKMLSQDGPAQS